MAEFRNGIGNLTCPDISREEIVNACGIDDFHDGVNYTRTACVIAVSKARDVFEPFLHQVWPQPCTYVPLDLIPPLLYSQLITAVTTLCSSTELRLAQH